MPPNVTKKLAYEEEECDDLSEKNDAYRTSPILFVNGQRVPEKLASQARPNQTLLSFLRDVMLLTGSKLGCAEGGCGACTVLVSKKNINGTIQHLTVNACLMPVLAADGTHVTTVEGVGSVKDNNLHPIQTTMVELHGSQCGYCTPGIIMALYGIFANDSTVAHLEEHADGNLCRCTGYRPIWDAARSLCTDVEDTFVKGPCGTPCRECPERDECEMECNVDDKKDELCCSSSVDKVKQYASLRKSAEEGGSWITQPNDMFPTELSTDGSSANLMLAKSMLVVDKTEYSKGGSWFKPTTLLELLQLLKEYGGKEDGGCKLVIGNTEVGIETRFKHAIYPRLIAPSESVEGIFSFSASSNTIRIGSCTPLSIIQKQCGELAKDATFKGTTLPIHDMLRWFASTQIRNVACLGGNLVTASPISDMNPMLAAMGAKLVLSSVADDDSETIARRKVAVSDFFLSYRKVDLGPDELVEMIEVPVAQKYEYIKPFKQARRREDDISIVTAGMKISLAPKDSSWMIENVSLAFGGMAPTTVLAPTTMKSLEGAEFNQETFAKARDVLMDELRLPANVPGGQAQYRLTLAASFLYKFYLSVVEELTIDISNSVDLPPVPSVDSYEATGSYSFVGEPKPSITGVQTFPAPKLTKGLEEKTLPKAKQAIETKKGEGAVGQAATHMSGPFHCTGEAVYTDDIPLPTRTLQGCLVLSKQCGCVLEAVDATAAKSIPGVVDVVTAETIDKLGGKNVLGAIVKDEKVFLPVGDKVTTIGQVIGIVVAETLELAEEAARAVDLQYGPMDDKIVVTIEDAIAAKSFYEFSRHKLERGDLTALDSLSDAPEPKSDPKPGDFIEVSGRFSLGGQEHFYLETNSTLAIPSESDLTIYSSTQAITKTQNCVAIATNTPASKVVASVKRMGGGFGGKETRSVFAAVAAAVAAKETARPVRLTLPRDVDMAITGARHAFTAHYKASAKIFDDGTVSLQSCDVKLYSNGGWAFDLSGPVCDRALFHVDGCYYWPNFRAEGVVCQTAEPNHTAFRGFGGPQGIAVSEHIIEHLAVECNVPVETLRQDCMYKDGQSTHFGMILSDSFSGKWNVPSMFGRVMSEINVKEKRSEIASFNSKHRWLKRGLAVLPTKFGIAFTSKFMNQGGALVHLYTDGTVLVTHGGTEMGQGLHTKVCQIAAQAFGIPVGDVYINHTSSDKVANTIPTAASMSTDMYGMATLDACRKILTRLEKIKDQVGENATLAEIATAAHFARIDLTAHGFFTLDSNRCGFDWAATRPADYPDDEPENAWKGQPFNYFTQGVAYAEVEVDTLTGNHRTLRCDVIVDIGSSISPMIDIGQIEGAFTQGMGWSTIEEIVHGDDDHSWIRPTGKMFTTGPGTYKLPAFNDVPEKFNITLLENADNPFAVHSSKAIGEPPFYLGASVFYAIKDAVRSARAQNLGEDKYFEMRMPGTSERIRMYCADFIAADAVKKTSGSDDIISFQPCGTY